jgi:hypothetical protein
MTKLFLFFALLFVTPEPARPAPVPVAAENVQPTVITTVEGAPQMVLASGWALTPGSFLDRPMALFFAVVVALSFWVRYMGG